LQGTNALAYQASASVTKNKSFMKLTPAVNDPTNYLNEEIETNDDQGQKKLSKVQGPIYAFPY
jgi:hypothetical protein